MLINDVVDDNDGDVIDKDNDANDDDDDYDVDDDDDDDDDVEVITNPEITLWWMGSMYKQTIQFDKTQ
ncbi:hypothetical protein PoB_006427600 [Plakobranchus ocellatus]|uniref:Uncharacterized protein n=1 Tax=Plakobranchus ocellatus TaxID=259542 RepID=A0AAV4D1C8_9GAST|nr:hypothetical protein PoB_006427600 [Plakobranchus ocellatus]